MVYTEEFARFEFAAPPRKVEEDREPGLNPIIYLLNAALCDGRLLSAERSEIFYICVAVSTANM